MNKEMNGIDTVEDINTGFRASLADWMIWLKLSGYKEIKKRIRKKTVQATEEE